MKSLVTVLLFALSLLVPSLAFSAEWTPLQLSLVHPLQIFPQETRVEGFRFNLIYGVNDQMSGVDIGLVNRTTGTTQGLQLGAFPFGGFNITEDLEGFQFAGFYGGVNIANKNVSGVQISGAFAGANIAAGDVTGLQIAGILAGLNRAGNLQGIQISGFFLGVNLAQNVDGAQLTTIYNQAQDVTGLQVGLVNICRNMKGVQIGLANIIKESKVPFLPVVNARF